MAAVIFLSLNHIVRAEATITDWSWTNPRPIITESMPIDDIAGQHCNGSYRSVDIVGGARQWSCVTQSDNLKVGKHYSNGVFRTVVSFAYDTKMYPVYGTGTCDQRGECIYIPQTDTFVTKQYLINGIVRSLVVYKDFTKRLSKISDVFGITTGYTFSAANPDYIFKSADGYAWPIEGLGVSNNGDWLAVEFRGRGLGILDMNTFEMKRISTISPAYGQGTEPIIELAITNNGQHVVMMGVNYGGIAVYDVIPSCGDDANDRNMQFILPIKQTCPRINIDTASITNRFMAGFNPRFDNEGGQLDFFAKSYTSASVAVTLRAASYEPTRLDYLALGDSFTSGEGETNDSYYQSGTNDEFEKCHLSKRSYPYLMAASLGIAADKVRSVACSGATTGDIVGNEEGFWGQGGRLKNITPKLNDISKTVYQASAKDSYTPGRTHQIEFVKKTRPKVITIGIGGNDVGFMDKLKTCIGFDTCEWADTPEGREKTAFEVQKVFDTLVSTYTSIQQASPKSKIFVIGYPKIIDQSGQCSPLNGLLLSAAEREFMNEGIIYINQVISVASQKAGVKYIDVESSFGNRILCGKMNPSVMNGIALGDDVAPVSRLSWLRIIGNESFHPRPSGHIDISSNILTTVPDMMSYDYCLMTYARKNNTCSQATFTAPQPSGYWLDQGVDHHYATLRIGDFIRDADDAADLRSKSISLPARTFASNSVVRAEVHSNPIVLGSAAADTSGALSFNIELPDDLEQGFHTVHLYGVSYSGEQVDLYQVIKYILPTIELPVINDTSGTYTPEPTRPEAPTTTNTNTEQPTGAAADTQSSNVAAPEPDVLGVTANIDEQVLADTPLIIKILIILASVVIAGSVIYVILSKKRHYK